jgi:hypothetical protein
MLSNPTVPRSVGRCSALIGLACLFVHIPMWATHFTSFPMTSALLAGTAMACIPCSRHVWRCHRAQDCMTSAALAATMLMLHGYQLLAMSDAHRMSTATSRYRHHGGTVLHASTPDAAIEIPHHSAITISGPMQVMFSLATGLAILQLLLVTTAVTATLRRHRRHAADQERAITGVVTETLSMR